MDDFAAITEAMFTPQELEDIVDKAKFETYTGFAIKSFTGLADHITASTDDPYVAMAAMEAVLEDYKRLMDGDDE